MEEKDQKGLFGRLTRLFRNGPVVTKKIKQINSSTNSTAFELFRKTQSQVYSNAMSAYGTYDRLARYADFSEMEYTPELSSALDIYSEEVSSTDENGNVLHIFSNNPRIEEILTELFIDTLNIEFNLTSWTRNLCKYGDFFLFNDVSPESGVINAFPIPVSEMEREEGFDKDKLNLTLNNLKDSNEALEFYSNKNIFDNSSFNFKKNLVILNKSFFEQPKEIILRSVTNLMLKISKNYYPPRGKRIKRLLDTLELRHNVKNQTLGGCIFKKVNESIIISKEIS